MEKDFSKWMPVKQEIHNRALRPSYRECEVWWCFVGLNIGFEIDGKGERYVRPVLIVKNFNKSVLWCLPVTTVLREGKYYIDIDMKDKITRQVVLSQLHTIDAKRLRNKLGAVERHILDKIKRAIAELLLQ